MALGNKTVMAENIQYYLAKNGKMPADMIRDLEFKSTTVYDWINARTYPRIDKIEMMANYFGIEKSDLVEYNHRNHDNDIFQSYIEHNEDSIDNKLQILNFMLHADKLQKVEAYKGSFFQKNKPAPDADILNVQIYVSVSRLSGDVSDDTNGLLDTDYINIRARPLYEDNRRSHIRQGSFSFEKFKELIDSDPLINLVNVELEKVINSLFGTSLVDLNEVDDSERDEMISANGQPISDEDWAIIKAVLAKYPKRD